MPPAADVIGYRDIFSVQELPFCRLYRILMPQGEILQREGKMALIVADPAGILIGKRGAEIQSPESIEKEHTHYEK